MSKHRKLALFVLTLGLLALGALPAFAQESTPEPIPPETEPPDMRVVTLTEDAINASFRVSETPRPRFENANVDLQPGQVVISADFVPLRSSAEPISVTTTIAPTIENGNVTWYVVSATTSDGGDVSDAVIDRINQALKASWAQYFREQSEFRYVLDIVITDSEITYSVATDRIPGEFNIGDEDATLVLNEQAINDTFRVTSSIRFFDITFVDLQPGQVVISGEVTLRGEAYALSMTVVPVVEDGRVTWEVTNISSDSTVATPEQMTQIDRAVEATWRQYVRMQTGSRIVTDVAITDADITFTFARRGPSTGN